jgi:thiamine biosynthesis lipoprotein
LFGEERRTPGPEEREKVRGLAGMEGPELDRDRKTVRVGRPGMEIDRGGLAKGYAVQKAAELLARSGVKRAERIGWGWK